MAAHSIRPRPFANTAAAVQSSVAARPAVGAGVRDRYSDGLLSAGAPRLLPVPRISQETDYTCGPASLRAVLALYAMGGVSEHVLATRSRTTEAEGTEPKDLARAARSYGLHAEVREGMSIVDLKHCVNEGKAVIVNYQAWRSNDALPWRDHWGDGHYAVVVGVDREFIHLEDPWLVGRYDRISRAEFVDRWHGGNNCDGDRFLSGGIVLYPK